jgi:hypothetical protein
MSVNSDRQFLVKIEIDELAIEVALNHSPRQLLANDAIATSRVGSC